MKIDKKEKGDIINNAVKIMNAANSIVHTLYEANTKSNDNIEKYDMEKIKSIIPEEINITDKTIVSRDTLTLSDIKYILNNNLVSELLLNKKVLIPNSNSETSVWTIIGINHDGTNNTIDLRSEISAIQPMIFDNSTSIYENSSIRKYLNEEFYNGFSEEVKSMIQTMKVKSNGKILEDKVKLLSMTELGLDDYNREFILKNEGNPYPVITHMLKNKENEYVNHMTRSRDLVDSWYVWRISDNGSIYVCNYGYARCAAPVIRIE